MAKIEVKGDERELEYLEENLESTEFDLYSERIEYEDEEHKLFFIEKEEFDNLDNSEIKDATMPIIRKISALATLRSQIHYSFDIGKIVRSEDNSELKEISIEMDTVIKQGFDDSDDHHSGWLEAAEENIRVEHMLNMLSVGFDWYNLYKLFELMEDDEGWIWKQDEYEDDRIELFAATAQSFDAIGLEARHYDTKNSKGEKEYKVPKETEPMSHSEAKSIIRNLCESYLEDKSKDHSKPI